MNLNPNYQRDGEQAWIRIIDVPIIKPRECSAETMTNGDVVVTVYGDTTNCKTYVLKGE